MLRTLRHRSIAPALRNSKGITSMGGHPKTCPLVSPSEKFIASHYETNVGQTFLSAGFADKYARPTGFEMASSSVESPELSAKMVVKTIPVSAVIPTRNRAAVLRRMLESLAEQSVQPAEVLIVDGSEDQSTAELCADPPVGLKGRLTCQRATQLGAALQRNQGVGAASLGVIMFADDDILFEPECVARVWAALESDPSIGGANAMITNQKYHRPGRISKLLFLLVHGREASYAGRVVGPAINQLPDDDPSLPDVVPVEWLNLGCTLYRREALPMPPFDEHFVGYSMMEDLALSLTVGRRWKLVNARTARIFHDSQPGSHKADAAALAAMELVNRHHVMTRVLGRNRLRDYLKLFVFEAFQQASALRSASSRKTFIAALRGRLRGALRILRK
jgi:glycosyltransferase involved in cell wall biosynthesis